MGIIAEIRSLWYDDDDDVWLLMVVIPKFPPSSRSFI